MTLIEITTIEQGFGRKATIVTNKLFFEVILPTRSRLVLNLRQAEAFQIHLQKWIKEAKEFQEMKAELREYMRERKEFEERQQQQQEEKDGEYK
jgi:hypothetical protein